DALAVGGAPAVDLIGAPSQPIDLLTASIPIWADRALPDPLPAFVGPEATRTRLGRVCDPVVAGVAAPAPAAGGARPALARKSCDRLGVWLLPDDRARFPVGDEFSDQLRLGADVLRLAGRAFGAEPAGTTAVRVVVRERFNGGPGAVLATGIARFPNAGPTTSVDVALDPPLPPRRRVHVDLEGSPDGGYLLLEGAQLLESESLLPGGGGP
ncbi:MAG: hypothetical protein Q8P18_30460, partial [Pseudomonadota bacterium]|nr:hypothetical protein [Pseudomonadota bacterium]